MSAQKFKEGDLALTKPLEVIVIESLDPDNCHQCGEATRAATCAATTRSAASNSALIAWKVRSIQATPLFHKGKQGEDRRNIL